MLTLAGVAAFVARFALFPGYLNPDDANRALVFKATTFREFRWAAFTETGQAVALALLHTLAGVHGAQFLAFAAALATPAVAYIAARRLGLSRAAATVAGLVLAGSNVLSAHAGTLKANNLAALRAAQAIVVAVDIVEHPTGVNWAGLAALTVAGTFVTILALPAFLSTYAAVFVASAWKTRRIDGSAIVAGAVIALGVAAARWSVLGRGLDGAFRDNPAYPYPRVFTPHGFVDGTRGLFYGLAPWSAAMAREQRVGLTLAGFALVGLVVVAWRRRADVLLLALAPVALYLATAARLLPMGIRFDVWTYPALAVAVAAAVDPVLRRLPHLAVGVGAVAVGAIVALMVDGVPYLRFEPSLRPLVAELATVPPAECVIFHDMQMTQFAWDTTWPVDLVGRVAGESWVIAAFPDRCVQVAGGTPGWFGPDVLLTARPASDTAWLVSPLAAPAVVPEGFQATERRPVGGWLLVRVAREAG